MVDLGRLPTFATICGVIMGRHTLKQGKTGRKMGRHRPDGVFGKKRNDKRATKSDKWGTWDSIPLLALHMGVFGTAYVRAGKSRAKNGTASTVWDFLGKD